MAEFTLGSRITDAGTLRGELVKLGALYILGTVAPELGLTEYSKLINDICATQFVGNHHPKSL